ncbi:autotransporter outer membrane beta-barrel domain-containing protein [Methylomonas sp. SURF-1]|uniref:Autotransporter outer membrane beta-barrel domain-containing protein n=1 Tax=Methylomonas aurea TaxID=2952224 RepID=A0ABT1UM62_9GAMM|nr:autotransporter outer membrane beta-barrel domain-containing protein [Methylomonas sp. SURF-1]MCQ8183322.1 autotransporter outer membrane beta-barrel domain-containing protein [Methylomonas sp. SURF-1]
MKYSKMMPQPTARADVRSTDSKAPSADSRVGESPLLRHPHRLAAVGLLAIASVPTYAASLDQQIRSLLAKDGNQLGCAQLVGSSPRQTGGGQQPLNFGPQLASLCGTIPAGNPPPVGGAPGGGAAGSSAAGAAFSALGQADLVLKKRRGQADAGQDLAKGGAAGDGEMALLPGVNLFFNADYRALDRRQTELERGYASNEAGFSLGIDTMPTDWAVAGLAVNYSRWHGDQLNGGGFDTDSYGPTLFASLFPWQGFFADLSFQYLRKDGSNANRRDYLREDNTNFGGAISGTPGADQFEGNLSTGYDLTLGGLTLGPRATVRYRHAAMDAYSEQGSSGLELRYLADRLTSVQSSVGAQASYAISTSWGVLVPQVNADWTHEYDNGQRTIYVQFAQDYRAVPTTFGFQTDRPDRDFFHVGGGLVAMIPNGWQAYANFEALLGHAYFDNYIGTVGIRLGL